MNRDRIEGDWKQISAWQDRQKTEHKDAKQEIEAECKSTHAVAIEKFGALAGDAKRLCVSEAKTHYGKS